MKETVYETFSAAETHALWKKDRGNGEAGRCVHTCGRPWRWQDCFYTGNRRRTWHHRTCVRARLLQIVQVYEEGRMPFYHFDVYRIGDIEEMDEIGYEDYFYGEGLCMIEWANLIEEILPDKRYDVTIEKDLEKGFDYRKITIKEHEG